MNQSPPSGDAGPERSASPLHADSERRRGERRGGSKQGDRAPSPRERGIDPLHHAGESADILPDLELAAPDGDGAEIAVSVVIPLLNESESLPELAARLAPVLDGISGGAWEVIFVDDGSTDDSFEVIRDLHRRDHRFRAIRFRTNFGKSAALHVGFEQARGRYVFTMDADLQDDPAELPRMLDTLESGYDLVSGWKQTRHDPWHKTFPSRFFNKVVQTVTGLNIHDFNCGLKAYRREVLPHLSVYGEMHRYLPAQAHWQGFRVTEQVVTHHRRKYGYSKFGLSRFVKGFLDLLTLVLTFRYGRRPLHVFGTVGVVIALVGFAIDLWLSIEWFRGKTDLSNRPLALLGVLLIIVGVQLISIGLLGEMIAKNSLSNQTYPIRETLE